MMDRFQILLTISSCAVTAWSCGVEGCASIPSDAELEAALHQAGGLGQPDLISRSGQPASSILGDYGRVGSIFGSFCQYDAVWFGFRAYREFRVYIRVILLKRFSPIGLARLPRCHPTQNVDWLSR